MAETPTLYVCHAGTTKLPVMKLADGTVLTPSREILAWVSRQ